MKKMNLEELLKENLVKQVKANKDQADKLLRIAERDLKAAEDNLKQENFDWALAMAYNAMLQSARALMQELGFIPSGSQAHLAVARFIQAYFKRDLDKKLLFLFDKIRKKRHQVIYEEPEIISVNMALQAIDSAKEFNEKIRAELKKLRK